uniref:NAD(P)H-quinone oxidoreductase subunit 5, chloroplastic n=1 Tax=Lygus hesperus TaxID=30085 RepID=A0A0A9Z513_LYGHE
MFNRPSYRCSAYNKRIKASISFLMLGTISLFGACLFAIAAHKKHVLRKAASGFGILSSVFLIISWVIAVAVRYRTSCTNDVQFSLYSHHPGAPSGIYEGVTNFPAYSVQEGVVLVIVAWLLCTGGAVFNMLLPSHEKQ